MAAPEAEPASRDAPLVVAIDGPSGVGKSTVARMVARALGVPMLDTGAMYRAVALDVLEAGVDLDDRDAVLAVAANAEVHLRPDGAGGLDVLLDGTPVGDRIRTPEVSDATSRVAVHPEVRARMVAAQRAGAAMTGAVVEGRDIGTVVFPDTPHKFFLDARPEVRAARRGDQLRAAGRQVDTRVLASEIARRDQRDSSRAVSPLVCDERYQRIDTSAHTPEQVVAQILASIRG